MIYREYTEFYSISFLFVIFSPVIPISYQNICKMFLFTSCILFSAPTLSELKLIIFHFFNFLEPSMYEWPWHEASPHESSSSSHTGVVEPSSVHERAQTSIEPRVWMIRVASKTGTRECDVACERYRNCLYIRYGSKYSIEKSKPYNKNMCSSPV